MKYKASIVELPAIKLVVCRASEFPAGIKDSWIRLESRLPSLKDRKFYGLTFMEDDHLVYYAGLEPLNDEETASMGFPTMELKSGKYARVKLMDWEQHTEEIAEILGELLDEYKKDPGGPSVEFYRSQSELHLMIPLAEG